MEVPLPSFPKRPCSSDHLLISDFRVLPNHDTIDRSLLSLLALRDPSVSIDVSLERIIDWTAQESEKEKLIENAIRFASAVHEAAMRFARKLSSIHNAASWPLPSDLTVNVFSILDTRSLCHAAAACSMFYKCAGDPICYCNVDLTAKDSMINNTVVSTMIQRAGRSLRSLKLGLVPTLFSSVISMNVLNFSWCGRYPRQVNVPCLLTRSCLLALNADGGAAGAFLRCLHLYNIDKMDGPAFSIALSVCPSLLDLKVVGLNIELGQILTFVSSNCHSMEQLFVESLEAGSDDSLKFPNCIDLINGCSQIMSLSLRGFKLSDDIARILIKGLTNMKRVDFSTSCSITGLFLRNLSNDSIGKSLEVLILRDCFHIKEPEISRFISALISGDCSNLTYLDISNKEGLSDGDNWNARRSNLSIPLSRISEERPGLCFLASFPSEQLFCEGMEHFSDFETGSFSENDHHLVISSDCMDSSDRDSGIDLWNGIGDVFDEDSSLDDLELLLSF